MAKRAVKRSWKLFSFVLCPGVEPMTAVAERALRPRVRQRKIWGCFRTDKGAENADIMMSTLETRRMQRKNLFVRCRDYDHCKLIQKGE